jgi:hypothetical protein
MDRAHGLMTDVAGETPLIPFRLDGALRQVYEARQELTSRKSRCRTGWLDGMLFAASNNTCHYGEDADPRLREAADLMYLARWVFKPWSLPAKSRAHLLTDLEKGADAVR